MLNTVLNNRKKWFTAFVVLFLLLSVILLLYRAGAFLPRWILWQEKQIPFESGTLSLHNRTLTWKDGSEILWQSEPNWYVSDAAVSDFDRDGKDEVLFLLWRQGNYGSSHPFWEKNDTFSFFQHLYIFENDDHTLKRQWMSSALLPQFVSWYMENDRMHVTDPYGENSVWVWHGYGVERIE